jgi:hypothetical protein
MCAAQGLQVVAPPRCDEGDRVREKAALERAVAGLVR